MSKQKTASKAQNGTPKIEKNLDYWTNELMYFENAIDGLLNAHAILSAMRDHASRQVAELTPDSETVNSK